jgi:enamine deaminase RidA (YjgF/YER057c/UK114 family)
MKIGNVMMAVALIATACGVQCQTTVKRVYGPPTQRFANAVWAGDTLYVAGQMASPEKPTAAGAPATYGDTKTQALSALKNIETILKSQGLGMGDIVQMEVFLAGDPAKDGKMDFAGLNEAYGQYFGTAEQPNKPVRCRWRDWRLPGGWWRLWWWR